MIKGMLTSAETILVVADAIKTYKIPFTVVDPVRLRGEPNLALVVMFKD